MNMNFFRTILTWAAILVTAASSFLGCHTLPDGLTVDCSASWIGPQYAGLISIVLLVVNQIVKAFMGGTIGTGLVAPTVPVVAEKAAGTVTPAQVKSS